MLALLFPKDSLRFAGLFALASFVAGIALGAIAHQRISSRRNAPLGYRIARVTHEYTVGASDPSQHTRTRRDLIIPLRDDVRIIEGRYRPSMSTRPKLKLESSRGHLAILHEMRHPSDWIRYVVAFDSPLQRGKSAEVCTRLEIDDADRSASPYYRTLIRDSTKRLVFDFVIPSAHIEPGSVEGLEELVKDGNTVRGRPIKVVHHVDDGRITCMVKNPKVGFTYCLYWRWRNYGNPA